MVHRIDEMARRYFKMIMDCITQGKTEMDEA